ncbi:MAG: F0F1 ATP synthase subunit A [Oscillospiraceae bacterium]|nr:F0F1 ATP synthase subunit A [Oscillospiraceae bacterium]
MRYQLEGARIFFTIPVFGGIHINETIINMFIVSGLLLILSLVLTHKMEKIPRKKTQILAEKVVVMIDNLVDSTMGPGYKSFAPYIMALFASSLFGSLIGLVGLRSTTQDINTTATWAVMTAVLLHANGFKANGFGGYMKSFAEPVPFMLPFNLIGIFSTPLSMALRHFGNVIGGSVIMSMLYTAFGALSSMLRIPIPILQVGVPAILSLYMDLFSGFMQAFIFCMLTMVYISNTGASD